MASRVAGAAARYAGPGDAHPNSNAAHAAASSSAHGSDGLTADVVVASGRGERGGAEPFVLFHVVAHVDSDAAAVAACGSSQAAGQLGHEHVLCRVRAFRNGTFDLLPGFSAPLSATGHFDSEQWHVFRSPGNRFYRYRVELDSVPASARALRETEARLMQLLDDARRAALRGERPPLTLAAATAAGPNGGSGADTARSQRGNVAVSEEEKAVQAVVARLAYLKAQRAAQVRAAQARTAEARARVRRAGEAGAGDAPPPGVVGYTLLGEIASARGFEQDKLYIEYHLVLPERAWRWAPGDTMRRESAVTHTARGYFGPALTTAPAAVQSDSNPRPGHTAAAAPARFATAESIPVNAAGLLLDPDYAPGADGEAPGYDVGAAEGDYSDQHLWQTGFLCCNGRRESVKVHHFGHPIEAQLAHRFAPRRPRGNNPNNNGQNSKRGSGVTVSFAPFALTGSLPRLIVSVYSVDWMQRHALVGHGFAHLPARPGSHSVTISTWRPVGTLWEEVRRFFLGGGARLYDPVLASYPAWEDAEALGMTHHAGGWQDGREGARPRTARHHGWTDDADWDVGIVDDAGSDSASESDEDGPGGGSASDQQTLRLRRRALGKAKGETVVTGAAHDTGDDIDDKDSKDNDKEPLLGRPDARHRRTRAPTAAQRARRAGEGFAAQGVRPGHGAGLFFNRYGLFSEPAGDVQLRLNVVCALPAPPAALAAAVAAGEDPLGVGLGGAVSAAEAALGLAAEDVLPVGTLFGGGDVLRGEDPYAAAFRHATTKSL